MTDLIMQYVGVKLLLLICLAMYIIMTATMMAYLIIGYSAYGFDQISFSFASSLMGLQLDFLFQNYEIFTVSETISSVFQ